MKKVLLILVFLNIFLSASCDIKKNKLENCNFSGKSFENYNFSKKEMSNIDFSGSNMFGTIFNKTKMKNIKFNNANLFGAFFVEATLSNIDFSNSDISSADFTGASISSTSFKTATQEDTIFGQMVIEKPDIIKVKSCQMIIPNNLKLDWYSTMVSLKMSVGHSDTFIIGRLCNWHNGAIFKLNKISSISEKKDEFLLTYNSCQFPIYVSTDNKNIYLEDMYNPTCVKSKNISSYNYCNSLNNDRDRYMCEGKCSLLESDRDRYMCGGKCSLLKSDRDRYMCEGKCSLLQSDRDRYMCGGKCSLLESDRDRNMCRAIWNK